MRRSLRRHVLAVTAVLLGGFLAGSAAAQDLRPQPPPRFTSPVSDLDLLLATQA